MPCVHGLDEMNCPMCRIDKSSFPKELFNTKIQDLNSKSPYIGQFMKDTDSLKKDLGLSANIPEPFSMNLHAIPKMSMEPPIFTNELFVKRLKEIDIIKSDTFGISKKVSLLEPELKVEKDK